MQNHTQPPPDAILMQMLMARTVSFSLAAIARLGVTDFMSDSPTPVSTLAERSGTRPDMLYRLMRMLATTGVFTQSGDAFALTPVGRLLRQDAPGSLRNMAMMFADDWIAQAYLRLEGTLRTGQDAVTLALGENTWSYFSKHPGPAQLFQHAMTDFTAIAVRALLEAYDFTGVRRLADVGGGHGTLLAGVLAKYPSMSGVLFDLPEVISSARHAGLLAEAGERVSYEAGSFLETAPAGCDVYILKHIIHDWDDAHARTILSCIRERMAADSRVLLYEMIVPEPAEPGPAVMLDIEMMAATVGGKERTRGEFEALFHSAGLKLARVVSTPGPISVLEACTAI